MEPREMVQRAEANAQLPSGSDERFAGYGVMGLPFASGHVLALRRFPASSLGPGYISVWHRSPEGRWTFWQNVPPAQACPRYFGAAIAESLQRDIDVSWTGPRDLAVRIEGEVDWSLSVGSTPVTSAMNTMAALLPDTLWRNSFVLRAMESMAGLALHAGRVGMRGVSPNKQRFIANPLRIWFVTQTRATVRGVDLGPMGALPKQARLGDLWIPQRGILAIGRAFFEPFDAAAHLSATQQPRA
jgi:hypothetical protein